MSDSEVIIVSLAIGFGIGVVLLMVLWACKACLGKPKTADDDAAASNPPRRQSAAAAENAAHNVHVQLASRPEPVRQEPSARVQSPRVQRSHPPAAIQFPNEPVAPSPGNMSLPSPGPGPTGPGNLSAKESPQILIPGAPTSFASPSPLPTRLSDHAMQFTDTPSPQPGKPTTVDSSTSAASSMVTATPTPGGASTALPPAAPAASLSTTSTSHQPPSEVPTLAQLDPTVPDPTPSSGILSGAHPQGTVASPLPSGVPTIPSASSGSADPQVGGDGVPALDLDPLNEARAQRHNLHPVVYPDPSSSVAGTTAELGPMSDVSWAPNTASNASAVHNTVSNAPSSYRMPAPQRTVSATHSLESHQAQVIAHAAAKDPTRASGGDIQSFHIEEEHSGAESDATVTVDGLTMREIVDEPLDPDSARGGDVSFTTVLQMATGVEAVEGPGSFATACEDPSSPSGNEAEMPVGGVHEGMDQVSKDEAPDGSGPVQVPDSQKAGVSGTGLHAEDEGGAARESEGGDDEEFDEFESVGTPYTGMDTTRTVGAQSLAFMEGGQRYHHRPEARFVPEVSELQGGIKGVTGMNDEEPGVDLPPGAVMRGRDPLMDRLMSKLSQEMPDSFSRTTSADLTNPNLTGPNSAAQSPLGTPSNSRLLNGLGSRSGSGMVGEQKSSMNLSDNYRFIPDSNHDSLLSIPYNPEAETMGHSVAISDASEWTLSAPTRAVGGPSSALSRGNSAAPSRRFVPGYADSLASGFSAAFSEASDWTLSGGNTRQMPALRGVPSSRRTHAFSPLPSPSTRSQLGQSNGITSALRSGASNWTLSGATGRIGAPSTRFSQASRALDDGRSIAFTDGGSEWALSPRSTVVRDDLDVGHSERWMNPEDIKMPARAVPDTTKTRGLREKYEQKTLRQKYASDDTNVPEYAVQRVNDWMGEMEGGTRDEVMLRLTAQQNDFR